MEYNTICWRHSTALILIISSKSQEKTRVNDFLLKKCHQLFPRSDIHETVSRKKLCRQFWSIYYKTNFQGNSSYFLPRLNSREVYIIVPEWGLKQLSNIRRKKKCQWRQCVARRDCLLLPCSFFFLLFLFLFHL